MTILVTSVKFTTVAFRTFRPGFSAPHSRPENYMRHHSACRPPWCNWCAPAAFQGSTGNPISDKTSRQLNQARVQVQPRRANRAVLPSNPPGICFRGSSPRNGPTARESVTHRSHSPSWGLGRNGTETSHKGCIADWLAVSTVLLFPNPNTSP
jgi:hypothetical protein